MILEEEEEEEEEEERQEVAVGRLEIPDWWVHFVGPVIVSVSMMYRVSHKNVLVYHFNSGTKGHFLEMLCFQ